MRWEASSGVQEHVDWNSKIASTDSELQVTGTFDSVLAWQEAKEGVEAAVWVFIWMLLTASFVTTMKRLLTQPREQNELSAKVHRLYYNRFSHLSKQQLVSRSEGVKGKKTFRNKFIKCAKYFCSAWNRDSGALYQGWRQSSKDGYQRQTPTLLVSSLSLHWKWCDAFAI